MIFKQNNFANFGGNELGGSKISLKLQDSIFAP